MSRILILGSECQIGTELSIFLSKIYSKSDIITADLNKKTDVIAEQSYSERQLFEKAYERLKSELEVILGEKAKIKIDKALKRADIPAENEIKAAY